MGQQRTADFATDLGEHGVFVVNRLEALGILRAEIDEFGVKTFQVDASRLRWTSTANLRDPRPAHTWVSGRSLSEMSKLALLACLIRAGWRAGTAALEHHSAGQPLVYHPSILTKSRWYAIALLSQAEILSKVASISHSKTEAYYRCLCSLPADALASIATDSSDRHCRELLAHAQPLPLEWEVVEEAPPPTEGDEDEVAARLFALPKPKWICIVPTDIGEVKVLETWSHASGQLRYYAKCPASGHHRCFRYTQRSLYPTDDAAAAALVAWALRAGALPGKGEHIQWQPGQHDLESALGLASRR